MERGEVGGGGGGGGEGGGGGGGDEHVQSAPCNESSNGVVLKKDSYVEMSLDEIEAEILTSLDLEYIDSPPQEEGVADMSHDTGDSTGITVQRSHDYSHTEQMSHEQPQARTEAAPFSHVMQSSLPGMTNDTTDQPRKK